MRHPSCAAFAAVLLTLLPASRASAQFGPGFGYGYGAPVYGSYTATYGFGLPFVRSSGFAFTAPYAGLGYGYGPGLGVSSYNSAYSVYAAPGATFYSGGTYGFPAAGRYGYAYASPAPIVPGWGSQTGFAPFVGPGASRSVSTGPFMGLPRPNAGLIRVP